MIGPARPEFHLHDTQLKATERTGEFRHPPLMGTCWPVTESNPNLACENNWSRSPMSKLRSPAFFQEELTLFRNEDLERCQVELLQIHESASAKSVFP